MEDNTQLRERIAVLEADRVADREILMEIQKKVNAFHDEMIRYRGWFGAITFFGSSFVVAFGMFKDYILRHWN